MIQSMIDKITAPDREFGPIPFWFLNDTLTDDEIVRQLTDFQYLSHANSNTSPNICMICIINFEIVAC